MYRDNKKFYTKINAQVKADYVLCSTKHNTQSNRKVFIYYLRHLPTIKLIDGP